MHKFDWLEEKFRKRLHGATFGDIRSLFRGSGVELADPRQYQPGDASKSINWKLSAKHNKMYVNTYQVEQAPVVELFLDVNANWLGGETRTNLAKVQEFLADYALLGEEWHIVTHVYQPKQDRLESKNLQSLSDWYQYISTLDSNVRLFEK
ncbi:MAG: DUF58 domain-containing protein [Candidatus Peribacteria bacterium]|nr:MAG: DUF58 domain-containing protein [Candidatus Peribacteria bacterium]